MLPPHYARPWLQVEPRAPNTDVWLRYVHTHIYMHKKLIYVCMIYEILGMVAAGIVTRMSWDTYVWIPFGDHPLKLERCRED